MNTPLDKAIISDLNEVKQRLLDNGIKEFSVFDKKIQVHKNDSVAVDITLRNGEVKIKPKFPQLGNGVQIAASLIPMLILTFGLGINYLYSALIAIMFGQIFSFFYHKPQIEVLKAKVEGVLWT